MTDPDLYGRGIATLLASWELWRSARVKRP